MNDGFDTPNCLELITRFSGTELEATATFHCVEVSSNDNRFFFLQVSTDNLYL